MTKPKLSPLRELNAGVRIKFSAQHLARVALFAATHDIRYYLNGIRIEPAPQGGVYIIGCDGHCLAIIHDKTGTIDGSAGVIMRISPELLRASKARYPHRILGSEDTGSSVVITGNRVAIASDFGQEHTELETYIQLGMPWIEGTYPDYSRVLPDFAKLKPGFASGVNCNYLARLAKLKPVPRNGCGYSGVKFWQEPGKNEFDSSAIIVQHQGLPELLVIIMPMRLDLSDLNQSRQLFNQFPRRIAKPTPIPEDTPLPGQQPSDAVPL